MERFRLYQQLNSAEKIVQRSTSAILDTQKFLKEYQLSRWGAIGISLAIIAAGIYSYRAWFVTAGGILVGIEMAYYLSYLIDSKLGRFKKDDTELTMKTPYSD